MNKKGQVGFLYVAVGVVVAVIAIIMAQSVWFASTNNGTGGNFTAGSTALTTVNFIIPLMAIGLLVAVVGAAIGKMR